MRIMHRNGRGGGPLTLIMWALLACLASSEPSAVDPCKRQPFRGRCPPGPNGIQMRSQFVLRYYVRNGECISYPYGHCVNDENEPRLYRYKEECEDACQGKEGREATYATVGPVARGEAQLTVETASTPAEAASTTSATTTAPVAEKTQCQRQREKAQNDQGLVKGAYVPECTSNGAFSTLQCERGGVECFCVDANGIELKHSRSQKPDCEKIATAVPEHSNKCTGRPEPGPCTLFAQHWHFDEQLCVCAPFNYSGCGGNGNNYASKQQCEHRCAAELKCEGAEQPQKDARGELVNCAREECSTGFRCNNVQGTAICCPDSQKEKNAVDGVGGQLIAPKHESEDICALPKDRGPCDQYKMRFYFNRELAECKYFFYGGCEGNANNFARVEECERACLKGKANSSVAEILRAETELSITTTTTPPPPSTTEEVKKDILEQRVIGGGQTPASAVASSAEPFTPIVESAGPSSPSSVVPTTTGSSLLSTNRCQHPRDEGECAAQFVRWYWDVETRNCESFTYGGCNGNGNNFGSREECLSICHTEVVPPTTKNVDPTAEDVCESAIDEGQCGGVFMRYAFDRRSGECRQFQYGGCGGNGNNFASLADCKRKCLAANPEPDLSNNICEHRIDPGDCSGVFQRFGYDQDSNLCSPFIYGGCGGNGNNFATQPDCEVACVRAVCPPAPTERECDQKRCQLVKDAQGCTLCSCPPAPRHPPIVLPSPASSNARAPFCPVLDTQLCVEPCIIFLNRKGCQECVCPILPPSQQPSEVAQPPSPPPDKSVSLPRQPAPPLGPSPPISPPQSARPFSAAPPAAPAPPAPKFIELIQHGVPNSNNIVESLPPPRQVALPPQLIAQQPALPTQRQELPRPVAPVPEQEEGESQPQEPTMVAFGNNEICSQPLDPGAPACTRAVQRWYFNAERAQCESFTYTGCAGNRNHFFSQKECQIYCARFTRTRSEATPAPFTPPPAAPTTEGTIIVPSSSPPQPPPPPQQQQSLLPIAPIARPIDEQPQVRAEEQQPPQQQRTDPILMVDAGVQLRSRIVGPGEDRRSRIDEERQPEPPREQTQGQWANEEEQPKANVEATAATVAPPIEQTTERTTLQPVRTRPPKRTRPTTAEAAPAEVPEATTTTAPSTAAPTTSAEARTETVPTQPVPEEPVAVPRQQELPALVGTSSAAPQPTTEISSSTAAPTTTREQRTSSSTAAAQTEETQTKRTTTQAPTSSSSAPPPSTTASAQTSTSSSPPSSSALPSPTPAIVVAPSSSEASRIPQTESSSTTTTEVTTTEQEERSAPASSTTAPPVPIGENSVVAGRARGGRLERPAWLFSGAERRLRIHSIAIPGKGGEQEGGTDQEEKAAEQTQSTRQRQPDSDEVLPLPSSDRRPLIPIEETERREEERPQNVRVDSNPLPTVTIPRAPPVLQHGSETTTVQVETAATTTADRDDRIWVKMEEMERQWRKRTKAALNKSIKQIVSESKEGKLRSEEEEGRKGLEEEERIAAARRLEQVEEEQRRAQEKRRQEVLEKRTLEERNGAANRLEEELRRKLKEEEALRLKLEQELLRRREEEERRREEEDVQRVAKRLEESRREQEEELRRNREEQEALKRRWEEEEEAREVEETRQRLRQGEEEKRRWEAEMTKKEAELEQKRQQQLRLEQTLRQEQTKTQQTRVEVPPSREHQEEETVKEVERKESPPNGGEQSGEAESAERQETTVVPQRQQNTIVHTVHFAPPKQQIVQTPPEQRVSRTEVVEERSESRVVKEEREETRQEVSGKRAQEEPTERKESAQKTQQRLPEPEQSLRTGTLPVSSLPRQEATKTELVREEEEEEERNRQEEEEAEEAQLQDGESIQLVPVQPSVPPPSSTQAPLATLLSSLPAILGISSTSPSTASPPTTIRMRIEEGVTAKSALSDLFTLHHIQSEKGAREKEEAKGKGQGEVARQVVPIWGGLIEEGVGMEKITREEGDGAKEREDREEMDREEERPQTKAEAAPTTTVGTTAQTETTTTTASSAATTTAATQVPSSDRPRASPPSELVPIPSSSRSPSPPQSTAAAATRPPPPPVVPQPSNVPSGSHQVLPERCTQDRDEGQGGGYNVQWYFNVRNLRCEQFVWQGQAGNENRFGTSQECEAVCKFVSVPGVPRPVNVFVPPTTTTVQPSSAPPQPSEDASDEVEERPNEEAPEEGVHEHSNDLNVVKAATIALTGDERGALGMPAPAQAIGEMPSVPSVAPPSYNGAGYSAVPLPKGPQKLPDNLPPMLGPSPPNGLNYQTGLPASNGAQKSAVPSTAAQGLPQHVPTKSREQTEIGEKDLDQKSFGEAPNPLSLSPSLSIFSSAEVAPGKPMIPGVPVCPNGLNAMQYSDGRPVMCLPGMNQCPEKSVCFFNGMDYFCCPNEDDPYDHHVFGGYDGEEGKHGYKVGASNIEERDGNANNALRWARQRRLRRQIVGSTAFSLDSQVANSLRFDDKPPPARINPAVFQQQQPELSPCVQPLRKGHCQEANLRYYYDVTLDACRLFYYSGCGGNLNNFATLGECETGCKIGLPPSSSSAAPPSPPTKGGPCPEGALPLGGNNPVLCGDRFDSIGCPLGYFCAAGPPSVCCRGSGEAAAEQVAARLGAQRRRGDIRRKPFLPAKGPSRSAEEANTSAQQMEVPAAPMPHDEKQRTTEVPPLAPICSDGSDPLKNETSGEVVTCGAGLELDGQAMCRRGFYCSIDVERNVRICCPLLAQGANLASSGELIAPHFGVRRANPGEVIAKGSLPSDRRTLALQRASLPSSRSDEAKDTGTGQRASAEFGHMIFGRKQGPMQQKQTERSRSAEVMVSAEDPFEADRLSKRGSQDRSMCRVRPSEGRLCREDEPFPLSHLQYFFDAKEHKCKVFFHQGCGGNANRFGTRQECETRCAQTRQ